MSRNCQFAFAGRSGAAEWSFDEKALAVSPAGGRPLVFAVQEIAGIAGDGYTIELAVPGQADPLTLSKLGAEGPTLLDSLQRNWLVARAEALRLGGSGEGKPFSGWVSGLDAGAGPSGAAGGAAAAEPFRALLFEDVMVIAREGRDLDPVFIALTEGVSFDDAAYGITVAEWPERRILFSKMGRQTQDLLDSLTKNRGLLANEAAATLASTVPTLSSVYRGLLAGDWPPGRLRTLQDLESLCTGFDKTFRATWLAGCLRKTEGEFLLGWAGPDSCWLGCSREAGETGEAALLWVLARKGKVWFLEALTGEDRATYYFSGGDEMPVLTSKLLCAPEFSKEALYGGPEMLTGERAGLAIAAQHLAFLVELRAAFRGRVIHATPESWQQNMASAAAGKPVVDPPGTE